MMSFYVIIESENRFPSINQFNSNDSNSNDSIIYSKSGCKTRNDVSCCA